MKQLDSSVVRIVDTEGKACGTGFLVSSDGLIITCSHVLEITGIESNGRMRLIPLKGEAVLEAQILSDRLNQSADVAFLQLVDQVPDYLRPAVLGSTEGSNGHRFQALGYATRGAAQARRANGWIGGLVPVTGWEIDLLEIEGTNVDPGMSGAPVLDLESHLVVGLLVAYEDIGRPQGSQAVRMAYAVPAETLCDLNPKLRLTSLQEKPDRRPVIQTPPLPPHFVPRPELIEDLKRRLLTAESGQAGIMVVSAIQGLGGVGKSTAAAALAREPRILERFRHGVLWAILGQQPDVLSLLSMWIRALGDHDYHPTMVQAATTHLRTLLYDKAFLLVVDDAWDIAHVPPFLVGGDHCQTIITTRIAPIARAIGAALCNLDVMTIDQSLDLLSNQLQHPLEDLERTQATALAETVGCLPLALELAAAQIGTGMSWKRLLEDLKAEIARLETLEQDGARNVVDETERKRLSLIASFHLSLRQLSSQKRHAFAWLGILPEDVSITAAMCVTLWDLDETAQDEAQEILRDLYNRALLLPGISGHKTSPSYRLHDLVHDIARRMLTDPVQPSGPHDLPGLGLPLTKAHAVLLERYRTRNAGRTRHTSQWHMLRDDGYIHSHLASHMAKARWEDELHALLLENESRGGNGWYETRRKLGQEAGFLNDVYRAWQLAETKEAIELLGRYALIRTSINSLARNFPPALLKALVREQVWEAPQAIANAIQIPDHLTQAEALTELALELAQLGHLKECTWAVDQIQLSSKREDALFKLAVQLTDDGHVSEALAALSEIKEVGNQDRARASVVVSLAQTGRCTEALATLQQIQSIAIRAQALIRSSPLLQAPAMAEVFHATLEQARQLEDPTDRSLALAHLAKVEEPLQASIRQEAIKALESITSDAERAQILSELMPHLSVTQLPEAQRVIREIRDKHEEDELLGMLAVRLAQANDCEAAMVLVRRIKSSKQMATAIASLAPHLPDLLLERAIEESMRIRSNAARAESLSRLVPYLPQTLLDRALSAAKGVKYQNWTSGQQVLVAKAQVLAIIAAHLPESRQKEVAQQAMRLAQSASMIPWKARAFAAIAPHLPGTLLPDAMEAASKLEAPDRSRALAGLIPHLPVYLRARALHAALQSLHAIKKTEDRLNVLGELAPYLTQGLVKEARQTARSFRLKVDQAMALARLATSLPEPAKHDFQDEALKLLRKVENRDGRFAVLTELAPHLPGDRLQEALSIAQEIRDLRERTAALTRMAPRLAETGYHDASVAVARSLRRTRDRVEAFVGLAPYLPERLLGEILRDLAEVRSENIRADGLVKLVPHLPESLLPAALSAVQSLSEARHRARALTQARPCLSLLRIEELSRTYISLVSIDDDWSRIQAMVRLAPYLPQNVQSKALKEAEKAAWVLAKQQRSIKKLTDFAILEAKMGFPKQALSTLSALVRRYPAKEYQRRMEGVLKDIVPSLDEQSLRRLLRFIPSAVRHWDIPRVMVPVAVRFAQLGFEEQAIDTAMRIDREEIRANALISVASYLNQSTQAGTLIKALRISRTLERDYEFAIALAEMLPQVAHLGGVDEAWDTVILIHEGGFPEGWEYWHERTWVETLVRLVPYLPPPRLQDAITMVPLVAETTHKTMLLEALEPYLPRELLRLPLMDAGLILPNDYPQRPSELVRGTSTSLREKILRQALERADEIGGPELWAATLTGLAQFVVDWDCSLLMISEVLTRARSISDSYWRSKCISSLAVQMIRLPRGLILHLLLDVQEETNLFHGLALRYRSEFLSDLHALAPVIAAVGGAEAILGTAQAIQDVGCWWP